MFFLKYLKKYLKNKECMESILTLLKINKVRRGVNELIWAEIFNNTIAGSTWFLDKACSPGRWGVGYPGLYVIYRILNNVKPKSILELGLGQSTRLISQYVECFNKDNIKKIRHSVVEHDENWIKFFLREFELSNESKIIQLDREIIPYKKAKEVRVFKGFKETFKNQKFDFIFIDAPLGGDMKTYSRIDILSILPECLETDWIILIDDYNRVGEKNTLEEIELILKRNNINYYKNVYSGEKDCIIICSSNLSFLTSM